MAKKKELKLFENIIMYGKFKFKFFVVILIFAGHFKSRLFQLWITTKYQKLVDENSILWNFKF